VTDERKDGEPRSLTRRELIETTAAALLAAPLLQAVPGRGHPGGPAPRFFTAGEYRLVDELTEMILPADHVSGGARAAGVAAYLDARLAESLEKDRQAEWRTGLAAVDELARGSAGKSFMEAAPAQRLAVLTQMAANEASPRTTAERFFREIKQRTIQAYYTSQIGIHDDQQYRGNVYQAGEYAGYDAN
jgi:hypothetical protein